MSLVLDHSHPKLAFPDQTSLRCLQRIDGSRLEMLKRTGSSRRSGSATFSRSVALRDPFFIQSNMFDRLEVIAVGDMD
jgi:hypothetical protein